MAHDVLTIRRPIEERPIVPRPVLNRPGIAADATPWKEDLHPRDTDGKFSGIEGGGEPGGGGASAKPVKSIPEPKSYMGAGSQKLFDMIKAGLASGHDPDTIAKKIKDHTSTLVHTNHAIYANKLLGHLEGLHGLKSGSLGKAVPKLSSAQKQPAPAAQKTQSPASPSSASTDSSGVPLVPGHLKGLDWEKASTGYVIATLKTSSVAAKTSALLDLTDGMSAAGIDYIDKLSSYVIGSMPDSPTASAPSIPSAITPAEPEPPAPPPEVSFPAPHASSAPQQAMHDIATGAGSNEDKINQIKAAITSHMLPAGGYGKKYADELITALGGDPNAISPSPAAPSPVAPTPVAPTPAASSGYGKELIPEYWHKTHHAYNIKSHTAAPADLKRTQRILKLYNNCKRAKDIKDPIAKKLCPTLPKSWWQNNASPLAMTAVTSYTGGGYGSMNTALREIDEKVPPSQITSDQHTIDKCNALDEVFEHDLSEAQDDCIIHRGEHVPAEHIATYKAALAAGLSVRYDKSGFTSGSLADHAHFEHKNTQFEIAVKKGTRMVGVAYVSSTGAHENEVLLRHGQAFEIFDVVETEGKTFIKMAVI